MNASKTVLLVITGTAMFAGLVIIQAETIAMVRVSESRKHEDERKYVIINILPIS